MRPSLLLATWGGMGRSPVAPGTVGTLGAVPLWFLLHPLPLWSYLAATILLLLAGGIAASKAEEALGSRDHPAIVVDEVVGFLVTMAAVDPSPWTVLLGFALFRSMDILKPPPIRWLERRLRGGAGVMADDVLAGLYARALLGLLGLC